MSQNVSNAPASDGGSATPAWRDCVQCVARTDIGLRRANNQDAFSVFPASSAEVWKQRGHLILVADGMGAHAAGELASKLAVDTIPLTFHKLKSDSIPAALDAAISDANRIIHGRGTANPEFEGMGTTVSGILLAPQGAYVANVGDSRVYRLRGQTLEQLTSDHSLAWEFKAAGHSAAAAIPTNIITRSLGPGPQVEVDIYGPLPVVPGDVYLACTDGLTNQVSNEELGGILASMPLGEAMDLLVNVSNIRGGPDNITAVACRITDDYVAEAVQDSKDEPTSPPQLIAGMHPAVLAVLAISLAVTAGFWYWGDSPSYTAISALAGLILTLAAFARYQPGIQAILPSRQAKIPPFGAWDCTPSEHLSARLEDCYQQVQDAAANDEEVVTEAGARHHQQATEASKNEKWSISMAEYGQAINDAMEQLKQRGIRGVN